MLLFILYTPVFPLSYGSFLHAKNSLFHPILSMTATPGIVFDSCLDVAFKLIIFLHLFFSRFRCLPRPKEPLREGLFPQLQLGTKNFKSISSSTSTSMNNISKDNNNSSAKEALGLAATGWNRCYEWRTGLTYYEHEETKELLYCEGGPGAIYEETDVDLVQIGKGVYLGPAFKVS